MINALMAGQIDAVIGPARSTPVLLAEAQAVLRESETRFRQLAENLDQVFVLRDPGMNRILYVSPAYEQVFGRSCGSLYADPRSWLTVVHPDDRATVEQALVRNDAGPFELEFRVMRPDGGERTVRARGRPVHDGADQCRRVAVVIDDITERKQMELQMLQTRKMDAVGRLAAGIAHDFNNLLAVVIARGEMLAADTAAGDPRKESIDAVIAAAQRGSRLARQLLTFTTQEPFNLKVFAVNDVITAIADMLRPIVGEEVEIELELPAMNDGVQVDLGQFEQVLMNLALNARDAMPRGGRLTFRTTVRDIDTDSAALHGIDQIGRFVILEVTDTGSGMSPETLSRAFEPFFTTKGLGHGTGLGLATAYGIVTQSGGRITVYSELGIGTTFRIYLPAREIDRRATAPTLVTGALPRGDETILLVEDDIAVRGAVTAMTRRLGYCVLTAESGDAALALAESTEQTIDLLITDVVMPGMDGPTLVSVFRVEHPGARALLSSGYAGDVVAGRCTAGSVGTAMIQKPFSLSELAHKIREVLDAE